MHLMYVDESGDPGFNTYASKHYILSALVISQNDWFTFLSKLRDFRKSLKDRYRFNQREEIHASELIRINKIKSYRKLSKSVRISILKEYCDQIPIIFSTAKVINVALVKNDFDPGTDIQLIAWRRLIERFDTYLKKTSQDKGIIVSDDTDAIKLMHLLRKMRVYNPIASHFSTPYYNAPADSIIEDIFSRSSNHSYLIQTVDVIAHLLYRKEFPKGSLRKYNLELQFDKLEPVLLKEASSKDPLGIVRK